MPRLCHLVYFAPGLLLAGISASWGQQPAANFQPPPVAYVEQMVTTYRPVQQRVIVPVRQYQTQTRVHGWWNLLQEPHVAQHYVPVTRWEERIETRYVPVTERQYRPVIETTYRQMPPLKFATPPGAVSMVPRQVGPVTDYDRLGMVPFAPTNNSTATTAPRDELRPRR